MEHPTQTTASDAGEQKVLDERDQAQEAQLEAQQRGDTGSELKEFAKEVVADTKKFPSDVVEDADDPARREDEAQGTGTHPGSEPGDTGTA